MKYVTKQFLNDSVDESGYIICTATSESFDDLSRYHAEHPSASVQVQIGDCNKKIFLDFSIYDDNDVQSRIDKINVMINSLEALREHMPIVWEQSKKVAQEWVDENKGVEEFEDENESSQIVYPRNLENSGLGGDE